jgi:hypothetical protein
MRPTPPSEPGPSQLGAEVRLPAERPLLVRSRGEVTHGPDRLWAARVERVVSQRVSHFDDLAHCAGLFYPSPGLEGTGERGELNTGRRPPAPHEERRRPLARTG